MIGFLYRGSRLQLVSIVRRFSSLNERTCTPPYLNASSRHSNIAIEDCYGRHTFGSLLVQSHHLANKIKNSLGGDVSGKRIAYLTPNDSSNVITLWAIWLNKAIAVPLCVSHPLMDKQYFVDDSQAKLVIGTEGYADEVLQLSTNSSTSSLFIPDGSVTAPSDSELSAARCIGEEIVEESTKAIIIYTSGTTGRPKGVVLSHGNIQATADDMINYWEWSKSDVCLHVLPLHHVHGLINTLHVPLSVGAKCIMLPKFAADEVWRRFTALDGEITIFTAVPTVYAKLLEYYGSGVDPSLTPKAVKMACNRIRVMMCSGYALPDPHSYWWEELTGHLLKDRYGMTEILTIMANPLHGIRKRGTVGLPFASVKTIIAKEDSTAPNGYVDVTNEKADDNSGDSVAGELYVKGPTVFSEYWNKPEATKEAYSPDGWFKTGDTMCLDKDGYYKVLGRTSVDIIKSSGYKLSALDIESKILLHESIAECAVIGIPHSVYGQLVGALIVLRTGSNLTTEQLTTWCLTKMPKYSIPRDIKVLGSIPKNAMGKINKKALLKQYYPES